MDTFLSFVEYTLTGDYNRQCPYENLFLIDKNASAAAVKACEDYGCNRALEAAAAHADLRSQYAFDGNKCHADNEEYRQYATIDCCQSAGEVFSRESLRHAAVYVLADKYCIPRLRAIALAKIRRLAWSFFVHDRCQDYVMGLVRYVFENTVAKRDLLREEVVQFVAHKCPKRGYSEEVLGFVEEWGEFARGLVVVTDLRGEGWRRELDRRGWGYYHF